MKSQENPINGRRHTAERYCVLHVKRPSLLPDRDQNQKFYRTGGLGAKCGVSGKFLDSMKIYSREGTMFFQ